MIMRSLNGFVERKKKHQRKQMTAKSEPYWFLLPLQLVRCILSFIFLSHDNIILPSARLLIPIEKKVNPKTIKFERNKNK